MYYVEACLLGLLAFVLVLPYFRRRDVLAALCALWVLGVSLIYLRLGVDGQLDFYSNDQPIHVYLIGKLEWGGRPQTIQDLIDRRYLYVGPAYLSALVLGRNPSLKMLSLVTIGFLRPHLALAVLLAAITVMLVQKVRPHLYFLRLALTAAISAGFRIISAAFSLLVKPPFAFGGAS